MIKLLFVVAVIIGFANTAYAISCNVCSSINAPDCGDPFKAGKTYAIDCNTRENPMQLFSKILPDVKIEQASGCLKFKFESSGNIVTYRECFFGDTSKVKEACKQAEELLQGMAKDVKCGVCTTDQCNSSTSTGIFAATVVFLVVIVRLIS